MGTCSPPAAALGRSNPEQGPPVRVEVMPVAEGKAAAPPGKLPPLLTHGCLMGSDSSAPQSSYFPGEAGGLCGSDGLPRVRIPG